MGFNIKNEGKDRELAPVGTHLAQCVRILDMGTQKHEKWGDKRKVNLAFELLEEQTSEGEAMLVFKTYSASLTPRSSLAKDIKSWLGITIGKDEEYDIDQLLGKHCMVTVVHTEGSDNESVYANVDAITGIPKGIKVRKASTPLQSIYLNEEFDQEAFDELPDFLKEKIAKSPEYEEIMEQRSKPAKRQPVKSTPPKKRR